MTTIIIKNKEGHVLEMSYDDESHAADALIAIGPALRKWGLARLVKEIGDSLVLRLTPKPNE
jgi:hypothetical protein